MSTSEKQNGNAKEAPFMQSQRKRAQRLLRVGAFFLAGFVLLVLTIFVMGDRQSLFSNTFNLTSYFENVEGLKTGAAVVVSGIRVGSVQSVKLMAADTTLTVRVDMIVEEQYKETIRENSIAAIGQIGLVGDKHIEILTDNVAAPAVTEGSVIEAAPPTNYFAILEKANEAVENTTNITASLDTLFLRFRRGEGTLGKFLTDDAAYNGLVNVSASAEGLFQETSNQFASLTSTLKGTVDNVASITSSSENLITDMNNLVADMNKGKGTVGALLYDRSLYDSIETLMGTLNQTASSAEFAAREFGTNMRGLRKNWLVGGLFNSGEAEGRTSELMEKEIEIRREELRRQEELLNKREREIMKGE